MKMHEFTLILTADPDESEADRLYEIFDDGTIATIAGIPQIMFYRESWSLEEAMRSAILDVISAGFDVIRMEIKPGMVLEPA